MAKLSIGANTMTFGPTTTTKNKARTAKPRKRRTSNLSKTRILWALSLHEECHCWLRLQEMRETRCLKVQPRLV